MADADNWTKYLSSVYWAMATIVTVGPSDSELIDQLLHLMFGQVGYGDIAAVTDLERGVSLLFIICGKCLLPPPSFLLLVYSHVALLILFFLLSQCVAGGIAFALLVGRMTMLTEDVMNVVEIKFQKKLAVTEKVNEFRALPGDVRRGVRSYYNLLYKSTLMADHGLDSDLSLGLQRDIREVVYADLSEAFPVFLFGSHALRMALVDRFKQSFSIQDEWVLLAEEKVDRVFFLRTGSAAFVSPHTGRAVANIDTGATFGLTWLVAPSFALPSALQTLFGNQPNLLDPWSRGNEGGESAGEEQK